MGAIEKELLETLGEKRKAKEPEQRYLKRIADKAAELPDEKWEDLSSEAQEWVNSAVKANNDDTEIPGFPEDPDEKPAKKKAKGKAAAPEPETKPARGGAKGKKAKAPEPDEEDDDEVDENQDDSDEQEEEVEERPAAKKGKAAAKGKKAAPEPAPAKGKKAKAAPAEDEDEEDDKPAKGKKGGATRAVGPDGVKFRIKQAIIKNPTISADELIAQLSKGGNKVSRSTVCTIRSEFRHSLKVMKELGVVDITV